MSPRSGNAGSGLVVDNVSASVRTHPIVRGISLYLNPGEIVGVLGPNGAGKTTTFYIIAGIRKTESGSIWLDGQDITHLPLFERARLGLGYLPQEVSIFRGMTVEDNIMAILEIRERSAIKRQAELNSLLEEFSIDHIRKTRSSRLSGGERRRVEFARCLACHPRYILLDEPFAGLDPIVVDSIRELVTHLKKRNIGVLITDHNARETIAMVERVYVIFDGLILTEGTPHEVKDNEVVRQSYLGDTFSR